MRSSFFICITALVLTAFVQSPTQDEVELICVKKNKASNTCYYNFKMGGINYSYTDNGCKGKRETILKKANQGKLALVKEWKIPCTESKEKPAN